MNNKTRILFTSTFSTTFIREDLSFFRKNYPVTEITDSGFRALLLYLRALPKSDITFSWFASVYSSVLVFLTKIFRKRSIIVLGGVDVANIPELNYGIWNSWWKSLIVRYGIRHADIVLAVDESLKRDAVRLADYDGANIHIVPTGYNSQQWMPGKTKQQMVLTVAQCDTITRFKIKGIDFLIKIARVIPDVPFLLIGLKKEIASQFVFPSNMKYLESVPQSELLEYYQKAAVYLQPSFREGLPNTLCEAMLCECYPIGTIVGGIPTAIKDTGSVVSYGNISEAVAAIVEGLDQKDNSKARERIATIFTTEKREQTISHFIDSLINGR